jgi:hypothetical protein
MKKTNDLITDSIVMDAPDTEMVAGPDSTTETTTEPEAKEMSELDKLINKRTGYWAINLELADLKWIKNGCNNKFPFTGPNEAFMLMNCYLGFSSAIGTLEAATNSGIENPTANLSASAIEACALILNKYDGSGLDTAQRVFRIAIALNTVIMEMKSLDSQISKLREAETTPASN